MESIKGKDIVGCFNTVNQLWREIETLTDRLTILLRKEINQNGLRCENDSNDELEYAVFNDNHSGVCTGCIRNIATKSPRRRSPDIYFGFQVSLADTLIDIPGNDEPVIFMFAATEPMSFDGWYLTFPMLEDFDTDFEVENNLLLRWSDGSVVYGVRLFLLNNEDDLKNDCVIPLLRLQRGEKTEDVFNKDTNKRIIKLPERDALIS